MSRGFLKAGLADAPAAHRAFPRNDGNGLLTDCSASCVEGAGTHMLLDPIWFDCVVVIGAVIPIAVALYLAFEPSPTQRVLGPKYRSNS